MRTRMFGGKIHPRIRRPYGRNSQESKPEARCDNSTLHARVYLPRADLGVDFYYFDGFGEPT